MSITYRGGRIWRPAKLLTLSRAFDPRGILDDSYEERLACTVLEVHESICNEIYYYAEWWEIDAEELLAASCGRHI
jgi:hypothetical protein